MHSDTQVMLVAAGLALLLSGCAAPPNTPGQGIGKAYTPVIDTEGADTSRYQRDLDTCRKYAGAVDEQKEALEGLMIGMLHGATMAMIAGANSNTSQRVAGVGAYAGVNQGQNAALRKQERIMVNCMTGRGYRTLDGGPMAQIAYVPQSGPYATVAPAAPPAPTAAIAPAQQNAAPPAALAPAISSATLDPAVMDASRSDRVAMGYEPASITHAGIPVEVGKFTYQAERLPEVKSCHAAPTAKLIGRGPGMESYSFACSNGDFLSVRCEFGNCRVLR